MSGDQEEAAAGSGVGSLSNCNSRHWTVDSRNVIMFGAAVREGGLLQPGPHHSQCDLHQVGALVQGNPGSAAKAGTQPSPAQPA